MARRRKPKAHRVKLPPPYTGYFELRPLDVYGEEWEVFDMRGRKIADVTELAPDRFDVKRVDGVPFVREARTLDGTIAVLSQWYEEVRERRPNPETDPATVRAMKLFRAAAARLRRELALYAVDESKHDWPWFGAQVAALDRRANKAEIRGDDAARIEAWAIADELRRELRSADDARTEHLRAWRAEKIAELGRVHRPEARGFSTDTAHAQYNEELERMRRGNPSAREEKRRRYSVLRDQLRDSKTREKKAKKGARDARAAARATCERRRATIKQRCAQARANIRLERDRAVERERALRADKRGDYRYFVGAAERRAPKGKRYTRAESDSLAEHNIPVEYFDAWRRNRARFSYELEPDHRAEQFLEWLEENPDEVVASQADIESGWSDEAFAAAYEEHAR